MRRSAGASGADIPRSLAMKLDIDAVEKQTRFLPLLANALRMCAILAFSLGLVFGAMVLFGDHPVSVDDYGNPKDDTLVRSRPGRDDWRDRQWSDLPHPRLLARQPQVHGDELGEGGQSGIERLVPLELILRRPN